MSLHHGEALAILRTLPEASVDSIVTDPPAGIGFMGKEWDDFRRARNDADAGRDNVFGRTSKKGPQYGRNRRVSKECLTGDGFTDGGDRLETPTIGGLSVNPTCRRCGLRARTWEGGPEKCSCQSPDFDRKRAGTMAREAFIAFLTEIMAECLRVAKPGSYALVWAIPRTSHWTGTAIEDAGWVIQDRISHLFGQGFPKHRSKLKPACEDWWLAWKPDRYATPLPGLDACRIGVGEGGERDGEDSAERTYGERSGFGMKPGPRGGDANGRWPANLTLDEAAAAMLDEQAGELTSGKPAGMKAGGKLNCYSEFAGGIPVTGFGDTGGASRFFYVAKASKANREEGNTHPTVKNTELMRWLCRLITPPGGTVLDCFMGSGTTGIAALEEKFEFIGIEREEKYFEIAKRRITAPAGPLFG